MCGSYPIRALAHLPATVHARREHCGRDLSAHIIQRLGQDAHRVLWGGGSCVLKGDGQDHTFAGKDGLVFALLPSIQEPLDPKETSRSSWQPGLCSVGLPSEWRTARCLHQMRYACW